MILLIVIDGTSRVEDLWGRDKKVKSGLFELAQLAMNLDHVATEFLRFNRGTCAGDMIDHPHIRSCLRAHSNHENVSRRVRRKSNRFLPEEKCDDSTRWTTMSPDTNTVQRSGGASNYNDFPRDEFLDKQTAEDV
jgi:hypothetical protein